MLILSSTRQHFRICDVLVDIVRRHINVDQRRINVDVVNSRLIAMPS
jgi:hypothetical protein